MKNKQKMKMTRVEPRAMVPLTNGEAATSGMARLARNVRECEQSLQVTGMPAAVGTIAVGDWLLTLSEGHTVTVGGQVVKIDGVEVLTASSAVVAAHAIGGMIVIVAQDGLTYLAPQGDGWAVMNPADAVPQLSFTASTSTSRADIAAYAFAQPYSQWHAPLADVDTSALAGMLRTAWNTLNTDARASGRHTAPMLVRWAVRLNDDTYLWMSEPVRVGDETLSNANRISAIVNSGSDGFTGTRATVMTVTHYALDVVQTRPMDARWQSWVKSIDVFATSEAQLLNATHTLDYRCLTRTTGEREYVLEMGLSRRGADAIAQQLAASSWRLIATADATGAHFAAPVEPMTLSPSQCNTLATPLQARDVVSSTMAGGRLYCCTRRGDVIVSAPGNALAEAYRRSVLGVVPLAMAVVTRPLYSGGFGRYPVYVFTDDGIYAIPQGAMGRLGEARLVDRTVIAPGVAPVEAGRDVWLMSRHGHLCRLSGSQLTVMVRHVNYRGMAWCNAHNELWLLPPSGNPVVMMTSGAMSERTLTVGQLYSDPRHAIAVDPAGAVLDLENEQESVMPVAWQTHPVALDALMAHAVKRVVWHVSGEAVSLTLGLQGQRGIMAGDVAVSTITVAGAVHQPLAAPTPAWRVRSVRLAVTGEAQTGTLLLPSLIYHCPD